MPNIIDKINKAREAKHITKTAFAKLIDVSRDTVQNLSEDTLKYSTLKKISVVLGVPISHFISEKKEETVYKLLNDPQETYGKENSVNKILQQRIIDLEKTIATQDKTISAQERVINSLEQQLKKQKI